MLVLGPNDAPTVACALDSVQGSWDKPPLALPADISFEEEQWRRAEYAAQPPVPCLVLTGPFGKLRLFASPDFAKRCLPDHNLEPLVSAVATHQIDRLPWPVEAVENEGMFVRPPFLSP